MRYGSGGGRKQYDNNMRIVLFENQNKRRGKKDPDMQGSFEMDGQKYYVDVWWNEGKNGEFLSGNLKPAEEQSPQQRNNSRVSRRNNDDDFDRDDRRRASSRRDERDDPQERRTNRGRDDMEDDLEDVPF